MIKAFNVALEVPLKVAFGGGGGMEKFDGNGMTVKRGSGGESGPRGLAVQQTPRARATNIRSNHILQFRLIVNNFCLKFCSSYVQALFEVVTGRSCGIRY